ncbi:hypothetical protein SUGI_0609020 [Cryptomeria japonica]|nr:hypothetical protein SUGI_0609020 [Cryptomeria japonica]
MVESACNAYVHENKPANLELYQGEYPWCDFFKSILNGQIVEGIPNWQCKCPAKYCNRVGPFYNQGDFSNSRIQGFECMDSNVNATIRVLPALENHTGSS